MHASGQKRPTKNDTGNVGEDLAAAMLVAAGWTIVERNWRCSQGELDIIAKDRHTLVVVEVKTRTSVKFGHPVQAITAAKAARLRRLTGRWLSEQPSSFPEVRIDVIAILLPQGQPFEVLHLRGVQ